MNISDGRFKIQTFLRMANLTTDDENRQRYLDMAEQTLLDMYSCGNYENPIHSFVAEMIVFDSKAIISRKDVHNLYLDYCSRKKYMPLSRNLFYKVLREDFCVSQLMNNGNVVFAGIRTRESGETEC